MRKKFRRWEDVSIWGVIISTDAGIGKEEETSIGGGKMWGTLRKLWGKRAKCVKAKRCMRALRFQQ